MDNKITMTHSFRSNVTRQLNYFYILCVMPTQILLVENLKFYETRGLPAPFLICPLFVYSIRLYKRFIKLLFGGLRPYSKRNL